MPTETDESTWLSAARELSMGELLELSGLSAQELQELIDYGALTPLHGAATPLVFASHCLLTVRTASRLRQGFDLEPHGLALAVTLLGRIRDLEVQLEQVRARLPRSFR
jgi:chaperone modulatory protein CbpM